MTLQSGEQVGAYTIDSPIGRGGMATVYKAYHERLDRHVAIKLMHETFLQDENFRERFQREARIIAKLEHPAIVQIYDSDEYKNTPYLVMKYVEGMTLKKQFIKKGMTIEEIERIMTRVAEGLDYAHSRGVLHRDMKPSNILLDNSGNAYITDFGLARIAEAGASTISHDMMLGTPYYISPEQAQGSKDLDHRTDIYSLGIILYELLTGQVPFQADTPYAIVHGHIYTKPELPSKVNPDLTSSIDKVLSRALEKNRENRYPSAIALMRDFSLAIQGQAPQYTPSDSAFVNPVDNYVPDNPTVIEPSHHISAKPMPTSRQDRVESPVRRSRSDSDFDFDMGDLNWDNIRDGFQTGVQSLAEMIEERIDTELRQRRGIALTEDELARRRVIKKMKERQEFVGHLASYIGVNGMLVAIWFFTGAGFFWPFFPLFFWGIAIVTQGIEYYNKYGPGAAKFEAKVQEELGNLTYGDSTQKVKKRDERLSVDFADNNLDIRLTEDGELTDSFIEEQQSRR
ncbi:MAG: protein kinase [Chloroflexota bacterium]